MQLRCLTIFRSVAAFIVLGSFSASATDYYVATNGNNTTYTNWTTAYTNIQNALNAAASGDMIYLAGHTFALTNQLVWAANTNVTIRGGYAATNDIGLPGSNNPALWPTVLTRNAAYSNRILLVTNVITGTLDRVTITGGYQINNGYGGGIYITGSTGLVISACVISSNTLSGPGGTDYGGGIYLSGGTVTLRDSIIANNRMPKVANFRYGGGVYQNSGICLLRNCLVVGNNGYHDGAGLHLAGAATLENCTVAYNGIGTTTAEGIRQAAGTVTVTNSIIWGNGDDIVGSVTLGWSDIEDGDNNGNNGCISADPLFERVFYLAPNSPAVDAGTNTASFWGLTNWTTRADGSNDSGRVDMGYHYATGYDFTYGDFYVATNGADGNSGTNWAEAYRTVTKALSVTRDGTRVHVGAGSYTNGSETFPLTVANLMGVQILGTNRATTVLNAAGSSNRVMTLTNCLNVMVSEVMLTGGYPTPSGGVGYGGGIALWNCGGVLSGCVISNNTLSGPGGTDYGGGLYIDYSTMTLRDLIIANNQIPNNGFNWRYGGGVYQTIYGIVLLRNCLVVSNTSTHGGAGLYLYGAATLENCTVAYNGIGDALPEGIKQTAGTVTVTNSIIWGNGDDIVGSVFLGWSDIEDGDNNGTNGCISANPLFVNTNAANYRLSAASPAINAGSNQSWMVGALDLDGAPRIMMGTVDMGAYESPPAPGTVFTIH